MINETILQRFRTAANIVVITGAGISKESGLHTYRDADGIWNNNPEKISSIDVFESNPKPLLDLYKSFRESCLNASPNKAHEILSALTYEFPITVITQNGDGLHQRANSKNVIEIHGSMTDWICSGCKKPIESIPENYLCECGKYVRPNVILFGEFPNSDLWNHCVDLCMRCDMLILIGTNCSVHPVARLPYISKQHGAMVVEINPNLTDFSVRANHSIMQSASDALHELMEQLKASQN